MRDELMALVGHLEPRWRHVDAVGRLAEDLAASTPKVSGLIVEAAWWHDVGYAPELRTTGHHAIDGARYLQKRGHHPEVVSLVAWHTGSAFEAEERGLSGELAEFRQPDSDALDVLTLIDLSTGPRGEPIASSQRVAEILDRYPSDSPVHRAVLSSQPSILAAAARARLALGLADDWPIGSVGHR